jgi:hypothetical protein
VSRSDASATAPRRDPLQGGTDGQPCAHCGSPFVPRKRWAKFCSPKCRTDHHAASDGGLRAVVSKVSVMRRGTVSVVLRFGIDERDRAAALTPGDVIEVLR